MIGGGVDATSFSNSITVTNTIANGETQSEKIKLRYGYVNPHVFANYKFPLKKGYVYLGPSAGYYMNIAATVSPLLGTTSAKVEHNLRHGYSWGAQIGTTVFISDKIGLNAEVGYRRAKVDNFLNTHFPLSIGVRYVL